MADVKHVATFSSKAHEETVERMRTRKEKVHDRGKKVYEETGAMDPLVSVKDGAIRRSKFAWMKNDDGTFTLVNGYKRPYMFASDTTGSFAHAIEAAFAAAPKIYAMLDGNRKGHQMDFSFSVAQDRDDPHDVIQVPQFESDERFANHMRLLIPDGNGGDTPEDYDLLIWYAANQVKADLFRYGGKGFFTLLLDAPGRGVVEAALVEEYLGCKLQHDVDTKVAWEQLMRKFHAFVVLHEPTEGAHRFWKQTVGPGRLILAPSKDLIAEVQSGLVHVTDTLEPTAESLYKFFRAGGQGSKLSRADSDRIWQSYVDAGVPFGADPKLGIELPKPGDIFAKMTDKWPIGHPRAEENATAPLAEELDDEPSTKKTAARRVEPIDWKKF